MAQRCLRALELFGGITLHLVPRQPGALALQLAFSPRTFSGVIHAWSADDLLRYRAHLPYDGLLLACYAALGWLLASRTALFAAKPAACAAARWLLMLVWLLAVLYALDAGGD